MAPKVWAEEEVLLAADINVVSAQADNALKPSGNLAGLSNTTLARANLGLGNAATRDVGTIAGTVAAGNDGRITGALQASNNLTDVASVAAARAALAIDGPSTVWAVGTAAGTVAAGNDVRIAGVKAFGAVGDGVTDDTAAFVSAAAALTGGGVLWVPAGTYMVANGFALKSGVHVRGAGRAATRIKAVVDFNLNMAATHPSYSFFYNENWDAANLAAGDSDISVSDITFDYSWYELSNAFASCKFRYVTRLRIERCYFFWGGNSVAIRGCEQAWLVGNNAFEFRNACWDFWEGPGTTWVQDNYAQTTETAQFVNFNPEVSPIASSPEGVAATRMIMTGNTFKCTGSVSEPCQIEPLADRDTSTLNVVISNNLFNRAYLVLRGQTEKAVIANNVFDDFPDPNTSVIIVTPLFGKNPRGVVISGNVINEPGTQSSSFGVIRCEVDDAIVTGNVVLGTTYTGQAFYQGAAFPVQYGNLFEKRSVTGRMRQGFILANPDDVAHNLQSCIGWEDTSGNTLRMFMSGVFHQFWSTNLAGNDRQIWSLQSNSDQAFTILVDTVFSGRVRAAAAVGLTATGTTGPSALQLTLVYNEVTTVSSGTGVRLPFPGGSSVTGLRVVIWNAGANTLNVYPMPDGQINALGTDVADTIAAGGCKIYVGLSATLYRIEP